VHASSQQQQQQQQAKPNPFGFGSASRPQQQQSFGSQFQQQQQQQQQQKPNPFGFGVQGGQSRNAPGPAKVCVSNREREWNLFLLFVLSGRIQHV